MSKRDNINNQIVFADLKIKSLTLKEQNLDAKIARLKDEKEDIILKKQKVSRHIQMLELEIEKLDRR